MALEGFGDAAVWADVQRRPEPRREKSIKQTELETLLMQKTRLGTTSRKETSMRDGIRLGLLPRQVAASWTVWCWCIAQREVRCATAFALGDHAGHLW